MFGNTNSKKSTENVFTITNQPAISSKNKKVELRNVDIRQPRLWGMLAVVIIILVGGLLLYHEATKPMTDTPVSPNLFASKRSDQDNDHYSSSGKLGKEHSHYILSDGFHD